MDENQENGVKINLISRRKLDTMSSQEKLRFILDEVKKGTVLVLERGLTAVEEIDLIKATMNEIDHETFIGIEMQSYSSDDLETESWFTKLLGRAKVPRMSVIGPANLLKTIHKNGTMVQAMILTGKSIVDNIPKEESSEIEPESGTAGDLEGEGEVGEGVPETDTETEAEGEVEGDSVVEDGSEGELDGTSSSEPGMNEETGEASEYSDTGEPDQETIEEVSPEQETDITEERSEVDKQDYMEDTMGFNYSEPEEPSSYSDGEFVESEQYRENTEMDLNKDQDTYTSEPEPEPEPEPVPTPDYTTESSDLLPEVEGEGEPEPESESEPEPDTTSDQYEGHDTIPLARPINEDSYGEPQTYDTEDDPEGAVISEGNIEIADTIGTTEITGRDITETTEHPDEDETGTSFLYKRLKQEEE